MTGASRVSVPVQDGEQRQQPEKTPAPGAPREPLSQVNASVLLRGWAAVQVPESQGLGVSRSLRDPQISSRGSVCSTVHQVTGCVSCHLELPHVSMADLQAKRSQECEGSAWSPQPGLT